MAAALSLAAQSNATDAAVEGYVTDAKGGVVAGARVEAISRDTNVSLVSTTDEKGYYRFSLLRIGSYDLTAAAPGMARYRREGIQLNVGRQARIDMTLAVAATSESVTVTADASMLETGVSGPTEILNAQALRSLPIPSRNLYNLHLIGPGVKGLPTSNFATTLLLTGGLTRTSWTVDGIDASSRRNDRQIRLGVLTPESVEEMQLLSGGQSAEFGRAAGSTINVVTRGGTNQFHGGGMFLYRPNAWVARPALAASAVEQSWWLLNGNIAGPLRKDKIWFFFNDEYNPYREPQPVTITPANAAALGLTAADTANSNYGETYHSPTLKVNFQLNKTWSGFARYGRFSNVQPIGRTGLTIAARTTDYEDKQNTGAAQLTGVLSPRLLSETRFGVNRRIETRSPVGNGGADGAYINIQGVANLGVNPLAFNEGIETSTQIAQAFTYTRGRHTWKAGVDTQWTNLAVTNALDRSFAFNGLAAANGRGAVTPLDQYLRTVAKQIDPATGRLYTYTQLSQQIGSPVADLRFPFLNWFVQDQFRVSSRLTLSFGIRQEMQFYPLLDADAPFGLSRRSPNSLGNFAPRAGFSYAPLGGTRTVIRGSWGLFYDTPSLNLFANGAINNGRRVKTLVVAGTDARSPVYPGLLSDSVAGLATAPSITAFAAKLPTMYGQNANLIAEREVIPNFTVSLQYSYWGFRQGLYTRDINLGPAIGRLSDGRPLFEGNRNRPNPAFNAINLLEAGANSNSHGLDVTLRRRFAGGLQLSTTWSWSHAIGESEATGAALSDPTNRAFDKGNLNGDARHSVNYALQFAPKFLRGFEISSLGFYNSGFPIDARAGVDLNGDLVLNDRNIGTARNGVQGPRFVQFDARVSRKFRFAERQVLEAIVESDNITNTLSANCTAGCTGAVVNRQGAVDFGRITTARTGRRVQFGFRYSF